MESKINYAIVGLFVVLLTSGVLGFVYWLAKHGGQEAHSEYRVYMRESVAGLSTDASVKYLGVDVGNVSRMELDPKNPEQVLLVLRIKQGTPITTDTRATIDFYGVTGLAYIELQGSGIDAPTLKRGDNQSPVIPSSSSTFVRLDEGLSELASKTGRMLDKIDLLLSDENLQTFAEFFNEIKLLAQQLRTQTGQLQTLIDNGVAMEAQVVEAFVEVETSAGSVEKMADELRETYGVLGHDMQKGMQSSFASLEQLLDDLDMLSRDMQRTVRRIEASPGDLIFKHTRPKLGPGELP